MAARRLEITALYHTQQSGVHPKTEKVFSGTGFFLLYAVMVDDIERCPPDCQFLIVMILKGNLSFFLATKASGN